MEWVKETHEVVVDFMLILIGLHVASVVFTSIPHGEALVRAMIN